MADPLSVGSAIISLISASARIAPMLYHFVVHTRDAPKSAAQILDEMNSITAALERLQVYLTDASRASVSRRSLLSLRSVVATLTACVTTYSDLEQVVGKCVRWGHVRRMKWLFYEESISELLGRVQAHKLSLVFMLTILQCESMQEAEDTMHRLVALVEGLITDNADLKHRIDALAADHAPSISAGTAQQPFVVDLNKSRVYRRLRPRESVYTVGSSRRASRALSAFSDLSLSSVSAVSVMSLPVWSADLANAENYRFSRQGLAQSITEAPGQWSQTKISKLDGLGDGYVPRTTSNASSTPFTPEEPPEDDCTPYSSDYAQNPDPDSKTPSNLDVRTGVPRLSDIDGTLASHLDQKQKDDGAPHLMYEPGERHGRCYWSVMGGDDIAVKNLW